MDTHEGLPTADQYRERLYEVRERDDLSVEERLDQILTIGREYLGVENGHVERIDADSETHTVVASVGGGTELLPAGTVLEAATTYCRRTIVQDSPLALSDASEQGWREDPAYEEHGFDCYLGASIRVGGETYGTVCFLSDESRTEFSALERSFVELVARTIGGELESRRYDEKLAAHAQARDEVERKYEALVTAAPDAIFLVDAETGEIVEANETARELSGYDRSELVDTTITDLHPAAQRDRYRDVFEEAVTEDQTISQFADGTPVLLRTEAGDDVPVEISTAQVTIDGRQYVQGIVRDISDRRERERELRVKTRAIDAASVGITIADAASGNNEIVYANDAFTELTGYDESDIVGGNCRQLQGPDTDEEAVAELGAAIAREQPVQTELLNYRQDGTPFWNEVSITPVEDDQGTVSHFVGFQRDVTDQKRRERLIAVLNRVLRHNLRNKMNVLTGRAELLTDTLDGEDAAVASDIVTGAWELVSLSEKARTLETVVRDQTRPEARDVAGLVSTVVTDLEANHPDVAIETCVPAGTQVFATGQLKRALAELVENAIEHGGDDPRVTVAVDHEPDGTVAVRVSDDGPGLPAVEQRILRRGRETQLEHGDGLGLWLVNWVVTDIGGRVSTAVDDDGTTVTMHLPAASEDEPDAATRHRQAAIGFDA